MGRWMDEWMVGQKYVCILVEEAVILFCIVLKTLMRNTRRRPM